MATYEMEKVLGSTAEWDGESYHLKDFAKRHPPPCLALVQRGHYRGVVQPDQVVYVHKVETGQKVLAEALKQPRRGRPGMNYSLPVTYAGWFELLSEDGKQIQPIQSVDELSKASPQQCIVRETFKAPFSGAGAENFSTEQVRQVGIGERLTLRGEVEVAFRGSRGGVVKKRYLRCNDDGGDNIFLGLDLRAQFSPIAGANNISGVHNLKGLLEKFRLPIVVRLVYGTIPSRVERNFSPVFRLIGAYRDETAFLLPLPGRKETKMITVSTREPLFLSGAKNIDALRENSEFVECNSKCVSSLRSYVNSIHVLVDLPDAKAISRGKETRVDRIKAGETSNPDSEEDEKLLFEEIEEIYRYVREGGDPPQPKTRPDSTNAEGLIPARNSTLRPIARSKLHSSERETERRKTAMDFADASKETTNQTVVGGEMVAPGNNLTVDDGFWEEQIYEEIDKIRKRKLLEKSSRSESMADEVKSRLDSTESDGMVKSLRQVYVRSQQPLAAKIAIARHQPQSAEDDSESMLDSSPPVPPKLFEGESEAVIREKEMVDPGSVDAMSTHQPPPPSSLAAPAALTQIPRPKSQPPKVLPKTKQKNRDSYQPASIPSVDINPGTGNPGYQQEMAKGPLKPTVGSPRTVDVDEHKRISSPVEDMRKNRSSVFAAAVVSRTSETDVALNSSSAAAATAAAAAAAAAAARNHFPDTTITPHVKSIAENQLQQNLTPGNSIDDTTTSQWSPNPQNPRPIIDHISPSMMSTSSKNVTEATHPVSIKPDRSPYDVSVRQVSDNYGALKREQSNSPATNHDVRNTIPVKLDDFSIGRGTETGSFPPMKQEHVNSVSSEQDSQNSNQPHQLHLRIGDSNNLTLPESMPLPRAAVVQNDPTSSYQADSSPRPIVITTNSSPVNLTSVSGIGSGVGTDGGGGQSAVANSNGVTKIRVTGASNSDPKFFPQMGGAGNSQIYVRFPNPSDGQTLYRPPVSSSAMRMQSGTVYLTNNKSADTDHWA